MASGPWPPETVKNRPNYSSLDDLISKQENKMELLRNVRDVVLGDDNEVREKIDELAGELRGIKMGIQYLKESLAVMADQTAKEGEALKELNNISAFLESVQINPDFQNTFPEPSKGAEKCPGTAAKQQSRPIQQISPISESEFNKVPSYVKGRMKLEDVNNFIKSFNETIMKKYNIIKSTKVVNYKEKQLQFTYKQQQILCPNTAFCTEVDLKNFGFVRPCVVVSKMINVLRAAQRVKEVRVKGNVFLAVS